jgi:hypothetical protein
MSAVKKGLKETKHSAEVGEKKKDYWKKKK